MSNCGGAPCLPGQQSNRFGPFDQFELFPGQLGGTALGGGGFGLISPDFATQGIGSTLLDQVLGRVPTGVPVTIEEFNRRNSLAFQVGQLIQAGSPTDQIAQVLTQAGVPNVSSFDLGSLISGIFPRDDQFGGLLDLAGNALGSGLATLFAPDPPEFNFGSPQLQPLSTSGPIAGQIASDPRFAQSILDFAFNIQGLTPAEDTLAGQILGDESRIPQRINGATRFIDALLGPAAELVSTGFRTDATPIFEEALRQLRQDVLPQVAETAGAQFGLGSSAFAGAASRAASDLLGDASLAQVQLDEAAAARRQAGLPLAANLAGTAVSLPLAAANDLFAIGSGFRDILERSSRRPLDVFAQLSGLEQNQPFVQQGFNPFDSTSNLLGALAATLPQTIPQASLSDLLGSLGGSGGGANEFRFNFSF